MYHCYCISYRSCNHINLSVSFFKSVFKNYHCKYWCSCWNITCSYLNTICCHHSCSGITFRRANSCTSLKFSWNIKFLCSLFRKDTCVFTGWENTRKNIFNFPCKSFRSNKFIKLTQHILVIITCCAVDREHSWCITYTEDFLSCKLPVDISCQRCKEIYIFNMSFFI